MYSYISKKYEIETLLHVTSMLNLLTDCADFWQ